MRVGDGGRLFAWEDNLLVECCSLLDNIVLQDSVTGIWFWKLDPNHGYTIKRVYNQLTLEEQHIHSSLMDIIWNKLVPLSLPFQAT